MCRGRSDCARTDPAERVTFAARRATSYNRATLADYSIVDRPRGGSMTLEGKYVVLGVTGSIAAFKAVALASELVKAGALVDVAMTSSAREFIAPLSFQAVTHRAVHSDIFAPDSELAIQHVGLAERADVVVVAPATANTIAKLALGL